jgi:hypothetical protein
LFWDQIQFAVHPEAIETEAKGSAVHRFHTGPGRNWKAMDGMMPDPDIDLPSPGGSNSGRLAGLGWVA